MTPDLLQRPRILGSEEDMGQFLQEIRQYPLLNAQQERQLAQRCAEGDEDAIRHLVNANLRLVVSVAREYAGRGVPLLDLIQEGSIGLLAAARKFDYTLDYRFSTYATKWIRQGVTRCLENHAELIRIPAHTAERIRRLSQVKAAMALENGTEPTIEELAKKCDISPEKAEKLLLLQPQLVSLDSPVGEESTVGVLVEDLQAPEPQSALVRQELRATLEKLLSRLDERQQQVLRLHFGMDGESGCSLEEIGKQLDISKERVRQIEKQAMDKLKKLGADMGLEDFLT